MHYPRGAVHKAASVISRYLATTTYQSQPHNGAACNFPNHPNRTQERPPQLVSIALLGLWGSNHPAPFFDTSVLLRVRRPAFLLAGGAWWATGSYVDVRRHRTERAIFRDGPRTVGTVFLAFWRCGEAMTLTA